MTSRGVALSVTLLVSLFLGAAEAGGSKLAGIGDLEAYYNDFQPNASEVPTPRPKPAQVQKQRREFPDPKQAYVDTLQYEQFYDMPVWQNIIEGKAKANPIPPEDQAGYNPISLLERPHLPKKLDRNQRELVASELQATRQSAIAALGMEPGQLGFTEYGYDVPEGLHDLGGGIRLNGPTRIQGMTSDNREGHPAWANLEAQGTLAHEAAHRGLFKLMDAGVIPRINNRDNEDLVQHLMRKRMPGKGLYTHPSAVVRHQELQKMLVDFEARAAKYLKDLRPRGPR